MKDSSGTSAASERMLLQSMQPCMSYTITFQSGKLEDVKHVSWEKVREARLEMCHCASIGRALNWLEASPSGTLALKHPSALGVIGSWHRAQL